MSRLSEISFEPLEPYDGKLSCTVLRGERGSNAPDLPDITGVRPVWTDKTKTIYGSDDTFVTIDNVYHF